MARKRSKAEKTAVTPPLTQIPVPRSEVVPLDSIAFSTFNKRTFVPDDPADVELVAHLKVTGRIFEPLLLRPNPEGEGFRLIAGERRVRCGRLAGLETAPAEIFDVDDVTANLMTFTENHHRKDLHYLEEAAAIEDLVASGCPQERIAAQLGKPLRWVALRARLANLSDTWRTLVFDEETSVPTWPAVHLEVIALLTKPAQDELLTNHDYLVYEGRPNLAELRTLVANETLRLSGAPWPLADDTLCPRAGACSVCPHRSSVQPILFEDLDLSPSSPRKDDRCLDRTCWETKQAAFLARTEEQLRQKHPGLIRLTTKGSAPNAVPSWRSRPAKKNQEGAVPAIVVDGSERGALRWVFPPELPAPSSAPPSHESSAAPPPAASLPGQSAKSSLAEREANLDRRRKSLATDTMRDAIKESDQVPPFQTVLALASVFGTHQTLTSSTYCSDALLLETFPDINDRSEPFWAVTRDLAGSPTGLDDLHRLLWRRVLPVLVSRTVSAGHPEDIPRAHAEASNAARLLGIDPEEHLAQATAAIPDPASWARERAALARAAATTAAATEDLPLEHKTALPSEDLAA